MSTEHTVSGSLTAMTEVPTITVSMRTVIGDRKPPVSCGSDLFHLQCSYLFHLQCSDMFNLQCMIFQTWTETFVRAIREQMELGDELQWRKGVLNYSGRSAQDWKNPETLNGRFMTYPCQKEKDFPANDFNLQFYL